MKTFEEIFDSIIEEREEKKRKEKEEFERIKKERELKDKIIFAYQFVDDFIRKQRDTKKVNEFIEKEKLMDLIFKKFHRQVKSGSKKLEFHRFINPEISFYVIQDVLLSKLHNELPSYDITILQGEMVRNCYDLKIIAEKNPLKDKSIKPVKFKEEIPYINITEYDDDLREYVALGIFDILKIIPRLDDEELFALKEIGVVMEYQALQLGNVSFNRPAKPEIISVRIFSNIDDGVLEKLKNLFIINDGTHHYEREFSYSLDDDCNCVINMLKSWGLKEI